MAALTGEKSRAESFPHQGVGYELQWSVMSFTSPVVLMATTTSPRSSPGTRTPSRGKMQENSMWGECTTRLLPSRSPSYNVHEFNKILTLYIFLKRKIGQNILNNSWFRKFLHPVHIYLSSVSNCWKTFRDKSSNFQFTLKQSKAHHACIQVVRRYMHPVHAVLKQFIAIKQGCLVWSGEIYSSSV